MGFYDDYNFDGLKLFSQLKNKSSVNVNKPCPEFLSVIKALKSFAPTRGITVAEIGVGLGATSLQVLKMLDANDVYYAFDFEERLKAFAEDLQTRDFGITCEFVLVGNSSNLWDSYNWNLSNLIYAMREQNLPGLFDAVYLDGAHTFFHDRLAVCLLKELLKVGGILVLDDVFWYYAKFESDKRNAAGKLTDEQMRDYQILRVKKLFLDNDPNFKEISQPNAYRGVFQKISR